MKLDLFWRKTPVTRKWKLRFLDVAITPEVFYGMETLVIPRPDHDKVDVFQVQIFTNILNTKHYYWTHVSNETVMATTNTKTRNMDNNIDIVPLSTKLKQVIVKLRKIRSEQHPLTKMDTGLAHTNSGEVEGLNQNGTTQQGYL